MQLAPRGAFLAACALLVAWLVTKPVEGALNDEPGPSVEPRDGQDNVGITPGLDKEGSTPLYIASEQGNLTKVKKLLREGVDRVDLNFGKLAVSRRGGGRVGLQTPIYAASLEGHIEVVRALLAEEGIDPNRGFMAVGGISVQNVKASLDQMALDPPWTVRSTPLLAASKKGCIKVVKALLAAEGIKPNKVDVNGDTPLYIASLNGHLQVVRALLATIREQALLATLSAASGQGHIEVVEALLAEEGIDPNSGALCAASAGGHVKVVEALLDRVNLSNTCGVQTLLNVAITSSGDGDKVAMMLLAMPGVDRKKGGGARDRTPFFNACSMGYTEVVEKFFLVDKDMDPNQADEIGTTPLYVASEKGHLEVVNVLLKNNKTNVNQREHKEKMAGSTPLYIASRMGHLEVVNRLLEHGADVNIATDKSQGASRNQTPLDVALNSQVVEALNKNDKSENKHKMDKTISGDTIINVLKNEGD